MTDKNIFYKVVVHPAPHVQNSQKTFEDFSDQVVLIASGGAPITIKPHQIENLRLAAEHLATGGTIYTRQQHEDAQAATRQLDFICTRLRQEKDGSRDDMYARIQRALDHLTTSAKRRSELDEALETIERQEKVLREIEGKEGYCLFGTPDMPDDPQEAFQLGSALAFSRCAKEAKDFLEEKASSTRELAQVVEQEWAAWLKEEQQFPTDELLNAWGELLNKMLGRPTNLEIDEENEKPISTS